jgi:hypothetical protein
MPKKTVAAVEKKPKKKVVPSILLPKPEDMPQSFIETMNNDETLNHVMETIVGEKMWVPPIPSPKWDHGRYVDVKDLRGLHERLEVAMDRLVKFPTIPVAMTVAYVKTYKRDTYSHQCAVILKRLIESKKNKKPTAPVTKSVQMVFFDPGTNGMTTFYEGGSKLREQIASYLTKKSWAVSIDQHFYPIQTVSGDSYCQSWSPCFIVYYLQGKLEEFTTGITKKKPKEIVSFLTSFWTRILQQQTTDLDLFFEGHILDKFKIPMEEYKNNGVFVKMLVNYWKS